MIDTLINVLQMNKSLGELIDNLPNNLSMDTINDCFESQLPDDDDMNNSSSTNEMNIFDGNMNFGSIVESYYKTFSQNSISIESIMNLFNSMRQMIDYCRQQQNDNQTKLAGRNSTNMNKKNRIRYGFTSLSDKSDTYVRGMLGVLPPPPPPANESQSSSSSSKRREKRLTGNDQQCQPSLRSLPDSFDWRDHQAVTPAKNQGQCGSCWTFATAGSIESAYLIKNRTTNQQFDLSEQQMVDCASGPRSGCQGGTSYQAFNYVKDNGLTSEQYEPYRARDSFCFPYFDPVIAEIDNYCLRSRQRYTRSFQTEQLNDDDIQRALVAFGPLYTAINADPISTKNYRSGIFNDSSCPEQINHAVLLVGYTPDAWIIKNSWGKSWGEQHGYFRLARGFNRCGINTEIAYPLLNNNDK
ncbi:group 1 mite allergen-like protein [Dermatophagoides farinae]|uniref:Group 1 mite allergen-like protein n=1 Tax=Dermatophagoides farinae TaxID=6954 RepID=A0A9D4SI57_DERFA|nr:group 1 mite allergen-like protein [Dermatophagoides farinae]